MTETSYEQALRDLELRRAKCQNELQAVEEAITALEKLRDLRPPTETVIVRVRNEEPSTLYAHMSVRWAVLKYLSGGQAMKSADIAAALEQGGNESASKTTVSAVISDMVNKRFELVSEDSGYRLTETGKAVWSAIERSARYKNRFNPSSNES